MSSINVPSFDLSPVRLSYVAALRGVRPAKPTEKFRYAQTGAINVPALTCLAASNPQGQFFGALASQEEADVALRTARVNKVENVDFCVGEESLPGDLDYLCCLAGDTQQADVQGRSLVALAQSHLKAGGLLVCRYRAVGTPDDTLSFLIREFAPEMTPAQKMEFLEEVEALGALYFRTHPIAREALDKALKNKNPEDFFAVCGGKDEATSGTFVLMETLLPAGFSFAGDADIGANYLELAAPPESHEVLGKCRDHLLYEPIKDFVLERTIRSDIWVKQPAEQTLDPALLFGSFTFGITIPRERVPQTLATQGGCLNLQTPLFTRLIDLMCTLPMGIGDFLNHPAGFGMDASEVVSAIQVLVAGGIAQPMRTHFEGKKTAMGEGRAAWATPYNESLFYTTITDSQVQLASAIVGGAIILPVRDALVLQAIHRVGLANSASALRPELRQMIDKNPALAALVTESAEPSDEVVNNIITDVVTRGLVRWYAYGLLAA